MIRSVSISALAAMATAAGLGMGCGAPGGGAAGPSDEALPGASFRPAEPTGHGELAGATSTDGERTPRGSSGDAPALELQLRTADPTYGFTASNPVRVGGFRSVGSLSERRFLNALWGPEGQPIEYERLGSCCPFELDGTDPRGGLLDVFHVSYEGIDDPVVLYLDPYRSGEVRVPVGFAGRPAGDDRAGRPLKTH